MAFLMSVGGLYGVVAYSVGQRSREIGVRMALGAQRRSVYQLILGQSVWLVAVGLALGSALAVGALFSSAWHARCGLPAPDRLD